MKSNRLKWALDCRDMGNVYVVYGWQQLRATAKLECMEQTDADHEAKYMR